MCTAEKFAVYYYLYIQLRQTNCTIFCVWNRDRHIVVVCISTAQRQVTYNSVCMCVCSWYVAVCKWATCWETRRTSCYWTIRRQAMASGTSSCSVVPCTWLPWPWMGVKVVTMPPCEVTPVTVCTWPWTAARPCSAAPSSTVLGELKSSSKTWMKVSVACVCGGVVVVAIFLTLKVL